MERGRTNVIPSVCTVFVNEFGVYVIPIGRFVIQKPVLFLPSGKVVQALDDSYVGTIVRLVRSVVDAVDTAIEVFGKIA